MTFYIDRKTKILIQGIYGEKGLFYTNQMLNAGAQIVAGVSPGNGGDWVFNGKIPVFDTLDTAVEATGADASLLFVPAKNAFDAILESIWAEIPLIFCLTTGIPVHDVIKIKEMLLHKTTRLFGPGSPGMITADCLSLGIVPPGISLKGHVGVVSRSGPIACEVIYEMKQSEIGISSYFGLGNEPVVGTDFKEILSFFEADPETEKILLIGESGTNLEEDAANYISGHLTKPIIGFVVGKKDSDGSESDRLERIIEKESGVGSINNKIDALKSAGVKIAALLNEIPALLKSI